MASTVSSTPFSFRTTFPSTWILPEYRNSFKSRMMRRRRVVRTSLKPGFRRLRPGRMESMSMMAQPVNGYSRNDHPFLPSR